MTIQIHKYLAFLLLVLFFTFLLMKIWDKGKLVDSEERDRAYDSRIERLNNSEQYALLALESDWYSCSHCPSGKYWLATNEVWKYGTSINPESRYTDEYLRENNVYYVPQFNGTLQECLEEEARKIYKYYEHPQNLKRHSSIRIARPAGNKRDD
jgi:hypothetical protein